REEGHVAGRLRCRTMTRMSEPVLPPPSSRVGVSAETLIVRTQRIEEPVQLVDHIPAGGSAAWLRHGQGVVALGTAWAVHSAGPHRCAAPSAALRAQAATAVVHGEVRAGPRALAG